MEDQAKEVTLLCESPGTQALVNRHSTEEQVIDEDIAIANEVLNSMFTAWQDVKTVGGVCRMAATTMSVLESRRKLLLLPYGAKSEGSQVRAVLPID